ncbi:MAG TPA: response regulator transcription factor [Xanthobacteraceae bacterium]|jgi:RNA polymerase sigma factor (sigma-70 family)
MTSASPVLYVVDDDASFRTAVGRLLRASGYQVVLYESGDDFLQRPPGGEPGCILLDIRMPGLSGLELQGRLRKMDSILPIVFLTGHGDIPTSVRAIKAGAEDLLTKPVEKKVLLEAIERALARCREQRAENERLDGLRTLVAALTAREREVFDLVVRGKLNKQIAHVLGTSERTIKAHRHSIMQKLQVQSVAEAVSIAERLGILATSLDSTVS